MITYYLLFSFLLYIYLLIGIPLSVSIPDKSIDTEINAENVIYTLVDTKNRLIYIGEAEKLAKRFDSGHPDILDWDFYKFNQLPPDLAEHRLKIERMAIRDMAALIENKNGIGTLGISDYKLANRKIDK